MANQKTNLTASDKTRLVKIAERRYMSLRGDLENRYRELQNEVSNAIKKSHAKQITAVSKKVEKHQADWIKLVSEARDNGVEVTSQGYGRSTPKLEPLNYTEIYNEAISPITKQYNTARSALMDKELHTVEEISLTGVDAGEARELLATIPTPEALLPDGLVDVKAIEKA